MIQSPPLFSWLIDVICCIWVVKISRFKTPALKISSSDLNTKYQGARTVTVIHKNTAATSNKLLNSFIYKLGWIYWCGWNISLKLVFFMRCTEERSYDHPIRFLIFIVRTYPFKSLHITCRARRANEFANLKKCPTNFSFTLGTLRKHSRKTQRTEKGNKTGGINNNENGSYFSTTKAFPAPETNSGKENWGRRAKREKMPKPTRQP